MSVWSPMILIEFLLAPTVPSEPRPQKMQLMVSLFSMDEILVDRQRALGDVVVDAHGEVVEAGAVQVVEDRLDHGRGELLGAEAVAAADDGQALVGQGGGHVHVQGLAQGARLLGAVEDGDLLHRLGQGVDQRFQGERPVEADLDQAELGPFLVQVLHGLFDGFAGRAHGDDDLVRLGMADVVEQVVGAAGLLGRPGPCISARWPGASRNTGSRSRGPGNRRRGSAARP